MQIYFQFIVCYSHADNHQKGSNYNLISPHGMIKNKTEMKQLRYYI